MGRTLIQSFAHLRQTWVLVEGHIGAVLKQLEANAVSNIASHHLNLLKVSLYSQSVSRKNAYSQWNSRIRKCHQIMQVWSLQIEDHMEKTNRRSKMFSHDGHQIWKWSQEDREQATPLTDHELLHKLRFSHLEADICAMCYHYVPWQLLLMFVAHPGTWYSLCKQVHSPTTPLWLSPPEKLGQVAEERNTDVLNWCWP